MPKFVRRYATMLSCAVVIAGMLMLSGCEGSDTKKAVTKNVEQAVGADAVRQGQQIKQEAKQSMQKEMEQSRKNIDPSTAGDQQQGEENAPQK